MKMKSARVLMAAVLILVLGLGAGKGSPNFPPLPQVEKEIRAIVNDGTKGSSGLIKGKALLDEEFPVGPYRQSF